LATIQYSGDNLDEQRSKQLQYLKGNGHLISLRAIGQACFVMIFRCLSFHSCVYYFCQLPLICTLYYTFSKTSVFISGLNIGVWLLINFTQNNYKDIKPIEAMKNNTIKDYFHVIYSPANYFYAEQQYICASYVWSFDKTITYRKMITFPWVIPN
jgi:hypothetical protein